MLRSKASSAARRLRVYTALARDTARYALGGGLENVAYVDLADPVFNKRYTYLLLKFLMIGGLPVVMRYRERLVLRFNDLKDTALLFSEEDFHLVPFQVESPRLTIRDRPGDDTDKWVHLDYFRRDGHGEGSYTLPMTMHPRFYHDGIWDREVEVEPRVNAVLFAGNLSGHKYRDPHRLAPFGMRSRVDQVEAVERSSLPSRRTLTGAPRPGTVYLLDREAAGVGIHGWREFVAGFRFFLGLPGQIMPLCHNVVEAMSVGTVPVVHENYARLFEPSLRDGVEVLTYAGPDLAATLERAMALSDADVQRMSDAGSSYYRMHLTPEVVARRILSSEVHELRLCGEGDSVRMWTEGREVRR